MIKFTAEFLTTAFFSKVSHSSVVLLLWLNTVHSTCSTLKIFTTEKERLPQDTWKNKYNLKSCVITCTSVLCDVTSLKTSPPLIAEAIGIDWKPSEKPRDATYKHTQMSISQKH